MPENSVLLDHSFLIWLKSCKIVKKETLLELGTALILNPDRLNTNLKLISAAYLLNIIFGYVSIKNFHQNITTFYDI